MTSRRGRGFEGTASKGPSSPSSSSSEDNGFVNRPRVAGLYVKNLSREELDNLAEEGIYGSRGDPRDLGSREAVGGSQRSLNLPGTSRDYEWFASSQHHRIQTSRTPQPIRKLTSGRFSQQDSTGSGRRFYSTREDVLRDSLVSGTIGTARRSEFRIPFPSETRSSLTSVVRRSDDSGPGRDESSPRSSLEGEDTTRWSKHSDDDSSRLSPAGYEVFDQEDSLERSVTGPDAGFQHYGDDTFEDSDERGELGEGSSSHTLVDENPEGGVYDVARDRRTVDDTSPPPYSIVAASTLSPPQYEPGDSLSPLFPRCRTYGSSQYGEAKPSGDVIPGFVTYEARQNLRDGNNSNDSSRAEGLTSPPGTNPQSPDPDDKFSPSGDEVPGSGDSPRKKSARLRSQDSTRLRPPLVGTAGTSADSGTGDSGSAEIQVDTLGCLQPSASDGIEQKSTSNEGRSPSGTKTPGAVKGGKQTVKPFTKESLDRLENRTVQLVREYGFQPRRKTSVEDGAVLPHKFEPFPSDLYGRPLEEIDSFIYDEVSFI